MASSLFIKLIRTGCEVFLARSKSHEFLAPVALVMPNEAEYVAPSTLPTAPRRSPCIAMDMV